MDCTEVKLCHCELMMLSRFQFDFDWDDPDDKFAPEDETWKAEKAAQLRGAIHTWNSIYLFIFLN